MMWYLLTDEFDSMENWNPDCTEARRLKAETFEDAQKEAIALYKSLPRYNPGAYARNREFPRNPRLVLELVIP